jgi:hypothetical protein
LAKSFIIAANLFLFSGSRILAAVNRPVLKTAGKGDWRYKALAKNCVLMQFIRALQPRLESLLSLRTLDNGLCIPAAKHS